MVALKPKSTGVGDSNHLCSTCPPYICRMPKERVIHHHNSGEKRQ